MLHKHLLCLPFFLRTTYPLRRFLLLHLQLIAGYEFLQNCWNSIGKKLHMHANWCCKLTMCPSLLCSVPLQCPFLSFPPLTPALNQHLQRCIIGVAVSHLYYAQRCMFALRVGRCWCMPVNLLSMRNFLILNCSLSLWRRVERRRGKLCVCVCIHRNSITFGYSYSFRYFTVSACIAQMIWVHMCNNLHIRGNWIA